MALIGQPDLEARLGRNLTAEEQAAFPSINNAIQANIEKLIGSSVESVALSDRYFDGGVQHLAIDPCTDITSVTLVDDDEVSVYVYDTTDFATEPRNTTMKTMLRHRAGKFMTGINNIKINAKFSINGDPQILAIVKDAMLDSLLGEINNNSNVKRESIEGYSIEYASTEARDALNKISLIFPQL